MPRRNRLTDQEEAFYHITTRVVDKKYRFDEMENARNVELLRRVESFSGVEVVSFCFMSNHFHILLRVPPREQITEKTLLERIAILYGEKFATALKNQWTICRTNHKDLVEREQRSYLRRMNDIGEFMKTLKQRLSMSYNLRHDRVGTLWENRYNSILLEPTEPILSAVAAYIDLNPVRAGMVSDPKDYKFSSYGKACRGDERARAGLCCIYRTKKDGVPEWKNVVATYRTRMELKLLTPQKRIRLTERSIHQALENKGDFRLSELLGESIRAFSIGLALGSGEFLKAMGQLIALRRKNVTLFPLKE